MRGGELRLAKTAGPLRFTWSWPEVDVAALDPTMVVVSREPDGRWYVTFAIQDGAPEPLDEAGRARGRRRLGHLSHHSRFPGEKQRVTRITVGTTWFGRAIW